MSMPRSAAILLALLMGGATASATRAEISTATSSLSVQRGLSIASARPIRLSDSGSASLTVEGDIRPDAPALIRVLGDPGRVYRIRVPRDPDQAEGAASVKKLQILSANAGDVSVSGLALMDHQGQDLLQISGNLRSSDNGRTASPTALPLSIDYE